MSNAINHPSFRPSHADESGSTEQDVTKAISESIRTGEKVLLRYTDAGEPAISGIRRVSRPGMRIYSSAEDAPTVRKGLGISILSTPAGLLPDREARSRKMGGEILCEVW